MGKGHKPMTIAEAAPKRQKYGDFYWGVKVPLSVSASGEIYLMADKATVTSGGGLVFAREREQGDETMLALAPGQWTVVFAASIITGSAVAVEHWGECDEPKANQSDLSKERSKMTQKLRFEILERDKFTCKKCGNGNHNGKRVEVDHIIPVSKGGKTVGSNLETLCEDCNRGKHDREL